MFAQRLGRVFLARAALPTKDHSDILRQTSLHLRFRPTASVYSTFNYSLSMEASHVRPLSTFTYTPFSKPRSIRILTLQPSADPTSPLVGTLSEENLDIGPSESYEAISYVWGNPSRTASIACHGATLTLTQSIHDALVRLRLTDKPRRLWADQICINQNDVRERSQQVEFMNVVYQNAHKVLVWLGADEQEVAQAAVGMVTHLDAVFADEEGHNEFQRACSEGLSTQDPDTWRPLAALTKLPWFHRIWIVQEIGTSSPATLFWGDTEMDWETLSTVVGVLNKEYHHLRTRFHIGTPNIRYLYRRFVKPDNDFDNTHNRGNFVYELHRARHMLAEDPRDHVYAFLGHFSLQASAPSLAGIVADYSRPVHEVFCDVAIRGLTSPDNLIMLAANHKTHTSNKPSSLPSWVPDWRDAPRHIIGSPQTPHRACGHTKPSLHIDQSNMTLHIAGIHVDTISRCSWIIYGKAFQFRRYRAAATSPVESIWRKIIGHRNTPINLTDKYAHTGDSSFFALAQTMTNACIGIDRDRPYEDIPATEWLAHAAAFVTRAAESSTTSRIHSDVHQLSNNSAGDAFKWSHAATLVTRYRCFAVTAQGYYVLGPEDMQDGDVVAVLHGGQTPFVLRRRGDGPTDGWVLIGECYVHGLMNGEALQLKGALHDTFVIH